MGNFIGSPLAFPRRRPFFKRSLHRGHPRDQLGGGLSGCLLVSRERFRAIL